MWASQGGLWLVKEAGQVEESEMSMKGQRSSGTIGEKVGRLIALQPQSGKRRKRMFRVMIMS
jgi:hypothetical protein